MSRCEEDIRQDIFVKKQSPPRKEEEEEEGAPSGISYLSSFLSNFSVEKGGSGGEDEVITYWAMFHLLWQVGGKDEHAESNSILQTRGEMEGWWENILSGSSRGGRKSNWNYEVAFRVKEGNFARTYPNSFSEDRGPFPREEKRHRPTHAFFFRE